MCKGMDVLTIDANRLKIPFGSSSRTRGNPISIFDRGCGQPAQTLQGPIVPAQQSSTTLQTGPQPAIALVSDRRDQCHADPPHLQQCQHSPPQAHCPKDLNHLIIDVRARSSDPKLPLEIPTALEVVVPAYFVPAGYALFAIALSLCNLVNPDSASGVCVGLSPIPSICLAIHAAGMQTWVALGLAICSWSLPAVCCAWRLAYGLAFIVTLGVFMAAGTRRPLATAVNSVCLLCIILALPLAVHTQWLGVESRWGVTIAGFFLALQCISASASNGKVVYRIRHSS